MKVFKKLRLKSHIFQHSSLLVSLSDRVSLSIPSVNCGANVPRKRKTWRTIALSAVCRATHLNVAVMPMALLGIRENWLKFFVCISRELGLEIDQPFLFYYFFSWGEGIRFLGVVLIELYVLVGIRMFKLISPSWPGIYGWNQIRHCAFETIANLSAINQRQKKFLKSWRLCFWTIASLTANPYSGYMRVTNA